MSVTNGSFVYPVIVFWFFMLMTRETHLNEQTNNNNNNQVKCGEYLNSTNGIIQTPGFPKRFTVPIRCRWVIDASAHSEKNIVVYLTQLYVTTGLKFTDYVYYEKESGLKYSESSGHIVTPENVTTSPWIRSFTPYLVIEFELDRLEGNHLRFLDDKHNVYFMYGFNVTFELVDRDIGVRESCNARICSLLGECYANANYTKYECSCFQGFSGPNCAQGPLCEGHTCNNGGTCVHSSAVSFGCKCPKGFVGSMCEFPLKLACDGRDCNETECYYNGVSEPTCECENPQKLSKDRVRYEGIILLENSTHHHFISKPGYKLIDSEKSFEIYLEKAVVKYLKLFNVSNVERLKTINYTSGVDATFHFFASKKDEENIKGALKRFKEKEENLFGIKSFTLRQDSSLFIESVIISKKSIRVGQEFSISCIAQGSIYMTFTWLKDGAFINESVITRSVSMHLIYLSRGRYQYTLMIDKANLLDEGIYTCHVSDWHVQQCKGIHVNVAGPPEIRLAPMSATVEKGANLDIVCIPLNNRPKLEKFGYSWIKNKHLLKMMPGREVWEDLYLSHYNGEINTGSVLEITNIQKSATYTCQAQGTGASSELSVHIEVVNKTVVPLCLAEGKYGIAWQTTAPGMETVADCPFHAGGHAKRECRLTDYNTTEWNVPNFTGCLTSDIEAVYNNFKRLTLGYEVTNGSSTLGSLLYIVSRRSTYLPGECERILDILDEVFKYLNSSHLFKDLENSSGTFYSIINLLMNHERCFITEKKIIQLQVLIKSVGIIWGSLFVGSPSVFQDMNSLIININKITAFENVEIRNIKFPPNDKIHPSWLKDKIHVRLDTFKLNNVSSIHNFSLLIAAYKNMTQFLKARYLTKYDDGTDQEFEINSKLVTIVLGRGRTKINEEELENDNFLAEIDFNHLSNDYDFEMWSLTCGVTEYASFRSTWNLNSCTSQLISSNVTKCRCKRTGTYALLVVSKNQIVSSVAKESEHFIVLIGCGCCLVQSLLTLCLLLPYWCRRKTCLVFLKMQCCLATACAMTVFMYSIRNTLSKAVFPLVTTFLEIFLLIGLSSHLSKILVVYTEIIQFPHGRHMKETVICIITGVPILAVLCNFLGYHSTGWNLHSWWIIRGSMIFNVFMTSAALLIVLFVFLYFSILRQLNVISQRCANKNKTIFRRIGLLKRGGIIFLTMIIMESASIFYINVLDVSSQYFFSSSSALLGFVIMFCYILRSECSFRDKLFKSLKTKSQSQDDDFSSESIISPLRFFTKHGEETESEGAPPFIKNFQGRGCELLSKPQPSLNRIQQFSFKEGRIKLAEEGGTSTLETFISSADGSIDDRMQDTMTNGLTVREPLSSFNSQNQIDEKLIEQDESLLEDEPWGYPKPNGTIPKPDVAQCYIRETPVTSQEIITTRVCVELGVITTHQKNETTGQDVATPAIVLCSVDVEPCQSRVLEMPEVVNDSLCCTNTGNFVLGVTGQDAENSICTTAQSKQISPEESKTEDCSNSERTDSSSLPELDNERKQPDGIEQRKVTKKDEDDNMEGMLDRISHDLDYLLNRKPNSGPRKASKPPSDSVDKRIVEEDEKELQTGLLEY